MGNLIVTDEFGKLHVIPSPRDAIYIRGDGATVPQPLLLEETLSPGKILTNAPKKSNTKKVIRKQRLGTPPGAINSFEDIYQAIRYSGFIKKAKNDVADAFEAAVLADPYTNNVKDLASRYLFVYYTPGKLGALNLYRIYTLLRDYNVESYLSPIKDYEVAKTMSPQHIWNHPIGINSCSIILASDLVRFVRNSATNHKFRSFLEKHNCETIGDVHQCISKALVRKDLGNDAAFFLYMAKPYGLFL